MCLIGMEVTQNTENIPVAELEEDILPLQKD